MLVHIAACDVYPRARAAILKHESGSKELRRSVRAVRKKQDLARQAKLELRKLKRENRDLLERIDAASRHCKETRKSFKQSYENLGRTFFPGDEPLLSASSLLL